MKALRSLWLSCVILTLAHSAALPQNAPPQPGLPQNAAQNVAKALLQAKTVYVLTGHVRYYKTKGLFKKELVDSTPFEEPCRKELEKWGRFTLVPDMKG